MEKPTFDHIVVTPGIESRCKSVEYTDSGGNYIVYKYHYDLIPKSNNDNERFYG